MNFLKWKFACCEYWDELLREYADNVFCVLSRSVRCDLRDAIQICSLQRFWDDSFSWSCLIISPSVLFWPPSSLLTGDACSFSIIEWRMPVLDLSSGVYDETSHQTWRERLIKLDEWKRHFIEWRKRLIKLDEWKRHLIKSDESGSSNLMSGISSNFEKGRQSLYFLISGLVHRYIVWET
jgi:hypothetical protein